MCVCGNKNQIYPLCNHYHIDTQYVIKSRLCCCCVTRFLRTVALWGLDTDASAGSGSESANMEAAVFILSLVDCCALIFLSVYFVSFRNAVCHSWLMCMMSGWLELTWVPRSNWLVLMLCVLPEPMLRLLLCLIWSVTTSMLDPAAPS